MPDPRHLSRAFLLSPANAGGVRMGYLRRPQAAFPLAVKLRAGGATLGEVFAFASALYFRGKAAYVTRFSSPGGALVIVPGHGLCPPDRRVTLADLDAFARVPVDPDDWRYRRSLLRDARGLSRRLGSSGTVVLLGSIASGKYVQPLLEVFGDRLLFPPSFIGRGDLSRGGLMLRAARSGIELDYAPVAGAVRRGKRPAKLEPLTRAGSPAARSGPSPWRRAR